MRVVHKYKLKLHEHTVIEAPKGSKLRVVGSQGADVMVWIEKPVEGDGENEMAIFEIYGTGHDIPEGRAYQGTAFVGPFVWHVYALIMEET